MVNVAVAAEPVSLTVLPSESTIAPVLVKKVPFFKSVAVDKSTAAVALLVPFVTAVVAAAAASVSESVCFAVCSAISLAVAFASVGDTPREINSWYAAITAALYRLVPSSFVCSGSLRRVLSCKMSPITSTNSTLSCLAAISEYRESISALKLLVTTSFTDAA